MFTNNLILEHTMIRLIQKTLLASLLVIAILLIPNTPMNLHLWAMDPIMPEQTQAQSQQLSPEEIEDRAKIFLKDLKEMNPNINFPNVTVEERFLTVIKSGKLNLNGFYIKNISIIPESLGDLIHLTFLDLKDLRVTKLPDSIGKLVKLEKLYLTNLIRLETLPDSIGNCTNLIALSARSSLKKLPSTMENLKKLESIDVGGTPLATVSGKDMWNQKDLQEYITKQKKKETLDRTKRVMDEKDSNLLGKLPEDLKSEVERYLQ